MTKVLLADDDFTIVSLLKTLLGMEGYQVTTLWDKKGDILDNIRKEKPDLLLIDIYLGDRNGMEVVRQIRQTPDLASLRVILTSGIDKTEECMAAGADSFLLKPYMPEELFTKLRDLTSKTNG
jgi:Response regulators consisting of a CheY-like receiver domain and a winged-helix DNA-binding domain